MRSYTEDTSFLQANAATSCNLLSIGWTWLLASGRNSKAAARPLQQPLSAAWGLHLGVEMIDKRPVMLDAIHTEDESLTGGQVSVLKLRLHHSATPVWPQLS